MFNKHHTFRSEVIDKTHCEVIATLWHCNHQDVATAEKVAWTNEIDAFHGLFAAWPFSAKSVACETRYKYLLQELMSPIKQQKLPCMVWYPCAVKFCTCYEQCCVFRSSSLIPRPHRSSLGMRLPFLSLSLSAWVCIDARTRQVNGWHWPSKQKHALER